MPDSRVDTIIDRLRNARSTGIDHRGEVRVPLAVAVAAVHAAAGLGSPDERLREALREIVADFPPTPDRHMDEEEVEQWYADHGDWFQRLSALAAADREKPGQKITHGRHCTCTPCRVEDWTNPALAPCGMHGRDCPREYAPLGGAGQVVPVNEPETATPIPDSEFVEPPLMPSDPISEVGWPDGRRERRDPPAAGGRHG